MLLTHKCVSCNIQSVDLLRVTSLLVTQVAHNIIRQFHSYIIKLFNNIFDNSILHKSNAFLYFYMDKERKG